MVIRAIVIFGVCGFSSSVALGAQEIEGLDDLPQAGFFEEGDKAQVVLNFLYKNSEDREKEYQVLKGYFAEHRGVGEELLKPTRANSSTKTLEVAKVTLDALMAAHDAKEQFKEQAEKNGQDRDKAETRTFWSTLTAVGSGSAALAATLFGLLAELSGDEVVLEVICNCTG